MDDKLTSAGKKVKLIISDLDGTLVNSEKHISKANREAIKKAKEQNKIFSICTGRIAAMCDYYANTLELDDPLVAANGAIIWEPRNNKLLLDIPMEEEEVKDLLEVCKFHQMDYCAMTLGTCYFSKNSTRIERFRQYNQIARANGSSEMLLDYVDSAHHCIDGQKVYKVLIYDVVAKRIKIMEEYLKTLKNTGYTSSEPGLLDVAELRVNKGYGVKKLAEILELKPEEVCAIGDYVNDIPMLQFAGFPVAMGNATLEVKEQALFVTKTNDEDGVAWVMGNYILN